MFKTADDRLRELEQIVATLRRLKPNSPALRFFPVEADRIDTRPEARIREPLPA